MPVLLVESEEVVVTIEDKIAAAQRSILPGRLIKGAGVLGKLWRAGDVCAGGLRRACPPECLHGQFCAVREKWVGLLSEYDPDRLAYVDPDSPMFLVEVMTARELTETGWTVSIEYPGQGVVKFGAKGQPWPELQEIGSSSYVWGEVVKIQKVML